MSELQKKDLETKLKNSENEVESLNTLVKELKAVISEKDHEIAVGEEKIGLLEDTEVQLRKQLRETNARWD